MVPAMSLGHKQLVMNYGAFEIRARIVGNVFLCLTATIWCGMYAVGK